MWEVSRRLEKLELKETSIDSFDLKEEPNAEN